MTKRALAAAVLASLALLPEVGSGFDDRVTHPQMTERAARASSLGSILRAELNLVDGLDALLRGSSGRTQEVFRWLRDGASFEDQPMCRAANHFHNPLRPFTSARVTDEPLLDVVCPEFSPIRSNAVWGTGFVSPTDLGPPTGNPFDWSAARSAFRDALALPGRTEREAALASTFEALGHVVHLVQDLAVPAHVRNDFRSHLMNLRPSLSRPTEESFERYLRIHPDAIESATPVPVEFLGRLVTRFWDTDRYTGADPSRDSEQGLAEYTNANFVSLATILTGDLDPGDPYFFPYPRLSSTNADALFGKDASVVRLVRAEDGRIDTGLYLDKVRDGETVTGFLRAGYLTGDFIDRAPPSTPRRLVLQLDDEVHRGYAAKLVPMALGYSIGLLDYFFRGRLDVDLVDDGVGLRLAGTNGSKEPLGEGTLAVYADGADGARQLVSQVVGTGRVSPAGTLPPLAVTPAEGAERFVAVYTGSLGEERAAGASPGAVIGRVLGGYRVEEVFADAARWYLRTPAGIYPLPILRSEIVELRWGDADNTLIGRTPFGASGEPNMLKSWVLARQTGSVDVPLRPAPGGGQEVDVRQTGEATFPVGLDVGGLQLNSTIDYQQYLVSFLRTLVVREGALVSDTYSDGKVERAVGGSASTSLSWRLTLDLAKFNTSRARPFFWQLQQIGLTTTGRMVALVRIHLTQPDPNLPESFAVFPSRRFVWCGAPTCPAPPDVQDGPPAKVAYGFGTGAANQWALVDVSEGRVIYSTAAEGVVIDNVIRQTQFADVVVGAFNGLVATEIQHFVDEDPASPRSFYPVDSQNNLRTGVACDTTAESGFYEIGRVELAFGVTSASVAQYPSELANAAFAPFAERLTSQQKACLIVSFGASPRALVRVATDEARVYLNDAIGALRVAGGSERVALLFQLAQGLATNFRGDYARVVAWDPFARAASLRHEALTGDIWQLVTAAPSIAIISGFNSPALTIVPLEGDRPATAFPMSLGEVFDFRALDPAFLYNIRDLKFHRYRPDLLRTALPASLAGGESAAGDYHTIRLP